MKSGYCWICGNLLKFKGVSPHDAGSGLYMCEKDSMHFYVVPLRYLNPELIVESDIEGQTTEAYVCFECGNDRFKLARRKDDLDIFESICLGCGQTFIFMYLGFFLAGFKTRSGSKKHG